MPPSRFSPLAVS